MGGREPETQERGGGGRIEQDAGEPYGCNGPRTKREREEAQNKTVAEERNTLKQGSGCRAEVWRIKDKKIGAARGYKRKKGR